MYKPSGSGSKLEVVTVKSRWMESGAGRSDVKLAGGDLLGEATVNECWDTGFLSAYQRSSVDPRAGYGEEATDCVFAPALYSAL
jgi:hypothetical protein